MKELDASGRACIASHIIAAEFGVGYLAMAIPQAFVWKI